MTFRPAPRPGARRGGSTRSRARRLSALVAGLCLVAVLAACASIPRTGPVVSGRAVGNDPGDDVLTLIPEGPRAGAPPEETVKGFLQANAGFGDDHRVARSFLTPQRRLSWRPDSSATIYPGSGPATPAVLGADEDERTPPPTPAATTGRAADRSAGGLDSASRAVVRVQVQVQATIDAEGRYTLAPPGQTRKVDYGLVRVQGEWRIDRLPEGVLISNGDFGVTFSPFPVYFPDRGQRYLVPDVHWFPGAAEIPTALVRALLEGPAPWLEGAVTTGAPRGTQMAVAAVIVADEVATVDLNDQARSASARQRQLLARQLQATLVGLSGIGSVKITVGGVDFDVPAPGSDDRESGGWSGGLQIDPIVDSRPVVIDPAGRLARIESGRRLERVEGVDGLAVPGASYPAVSADGNAYAVLGQGRGSLYFQLPGTSAATIALRGPRLTPPSFDPQGWVWSAPAVPVNRVFAARADAGTTTVSAPWLAGHELVSLRLSRDGARALVATRRAGRAFLFVSGVVRDDDERPGLPLELTSPQPLVPDLVGVTDAAWVDEDQVVVLGRRSAVGPEQPWLVQLGGRITATTPAPGATSITAGDGELALVAGTATGVLTRAGREWELTSQGRWPAFPG